MQLTIKQAAELLQASESQVRKWIRDRGLPAVMFNEQYRLNRLDLMAWAQTNQIPVPPVAPSAVARVDLGAALARGGIHRDLPGSTRKDVVSEAVRRLQLPPAVDRDLLLEVVVARQALGACALGHGIAIPHAHYPIVSAVPDPILGLGFLRSPVDFGAPDGQPVTALFVLVTPTNRTHLALLANLARALTTDLLAPVQSRADDATILAAARAAGATARSPQP